MRTRIRNLSLAAALLVPAPAFAHGGHAHVMGTVTGVDATHVEVKAKGGKTVSVKVDDQTKYESGRKPASASDVTPGKRVVIDTEGEGAALRAVEVRIGKAPAKR